MSPAAGDAEQPLRILSAGAPKTGVSRCAEAFTRATGRKVDISFVPAPVVKSTVEAGGDGVDIVVAAAPAAEAFEAAGRTMAGTCAVVGSVRAAVAVNAGEPDPDISSAEALRRSILAAPAVVYNVASSGLYIETMIGRLGIADEVRDRTVRLPTGDAVLKYLGAGTTPGAIGFGQATEIRRQEALDGLIRFVGALPKEVENITTYAVAALSGSALPEDARALAAFMGSSEGRAIFAATGVE